MNMLHRDGSTWHLLMPETFTGMLMDRSNRYAARFDAGTLSEAFGHPMQRVELLARGDSAMPRRMRRALRNTATTKCRPGNLTS